MPENKLIIEKDFIQHSSGFYAHLVDEVEANVSECYQGDYRLSFVSEKAPLKFDSWYSSYTPYVQHYEGFVIVLRFEAPYNFESVCI